MLKPFVASEWKPGMKVVAASGIPVRVLCVDGPINHRPVVGFLGLSITPTMWRKDGLYEVFNPEKTLMFDIPYEPTYDEIKAIIKLYNPSLSSPWINQDLWEQHVLWPVIKGLLAEIHDLKSRK